MVKYITDINEFNTLKAGDKLLVVDFTATWYVLYRNGYSKQIVIVTAIRFVFSVSTSLSHSHNVRRRRRRRRRFGLICVFSTINTIQYNIRSTGARPAR